MARKILRLWIRPRLPSDLSRNSESFGIQRVLPMMAPAENIDAATCKRDGVDEGNRLFARGGYGESRTSFEIATAGQTDGDLFSQRDII